MSLIYLPFNQPPNVIFMPRLLQAILIPINTFPTENLKKGRQRGQNVKKIFKMPSFQWD
jgi:hypothetical protein